METCNTINNLSKPRKNNEIDHLLFNNSIGDNSISMSSAFNDYFISVPINLCNCINPTNASFQDYLGNYSVSSVL